MTNIDHWIASWVDLACAVVSIVSLGFYHPPWLRIWRRE